MKTRLFHYGYGVWLPSNADLHAVFNAARKAIRSNDRSDAERYNHLLNVKRVCKERFMDRLKGWQECLIEIEKYRAEKHKQDIEEFVWTI